MDKENYNKNTSLRNIPLLGPSTEKMFQPTMLIFICQKPRHGYELIQELGKYGFAEGEIEPTTVYRRLRRMEEAGFLKSRWDTGGPGSARRLYEITPEGLEHLQAWGELLRRRKEKLEEFLSFYDKIICDAVTEGGRVGDTRRD